MKLPRVTDHAVLRYLERVKGIDTEAIRQHIAGVCAGAAAVGAICVKAEGVCFQLQRTTVVTVTPDTGFPNPKKRRRVTEAAT